MRLKRNQRNETATCCEEAQRQTGWTHGLHYHDGQWSIDSPTCEFEGVKFCPWCGVRLPA